MLYNAPIDDTFCLRTFSDQEKHRNTAAKLVKEKGAVKSCVYLLT